MKKLIIIYILVVIIISCSVTLINVKNSDDVSIDADGHRLDSVRLDRNIDIDLNQRDSINLKDDSYEKTKQE